MNPSAGHGAMSGNLFLDRAIADRDEIQQYLDTKVDLKKGQKLAVGSYTYFPINTLVSLNFILKNGYIAEIRQIGRDGVVGLLNFIEQNASLATATVLSAGSAYRIKADVIHDIFERSSQFRMTTLQYMQAVMQEASQNVICSRFHSISQQCCRSLLAAADRTGSQTVYLTHEQLAVAIGCRREAVSLAARQLQLAGIIHYNYGKIIILDRKEMETRACECYYTILKSFSPFLPPDETGTTNKDDRLTVEI
jgi:CRP-like cAMP-binding protein